MGLTVCSSIPTESSTPAALAASRSASKDWGQILSSPPEPETFADLLLRRVGDWSGGQPGEPLEDDVTLVVADLSSH